VGDPHQNDCSECRRQDGENVKRRSFIEEEIPAPFEKSVGKHGH
jgi:hypothetical protein